MNEILLENAIFVFYTPVRVIRIKGFEEIRVNGVYCTINSLKFSVLHVLLEWYWVVINFCMHILCFFYSEIKSKYFIGQF